MVDHISRQCDDQHHIDHHARYHRRDNLLDAAKIIGDTAEEFAAAHLIEIGDILVHQMERELIPQFPDNIIPDIDGIVSLHETTDRFEHKNRDDSSGDKQEHCLIFADKKIIKQRFEHMRHQRRRECHGDHPQYGKQKLFFVSRHIRKEIFQ